IIPTVTPALPTVAPLPTATSTPKPTPTPSVPTEIKVGVYVKVVSAEADELSYRSGPGLNYARLSIVKDGTILEVLEGPEEADGYTWWRLEDEDGDIGWAADKWLEPTLP
ncbi:MAG: SH3 domain-containing protein, partial [Anaerolineae bacterium]|nr:SH3 domain-containing protein [Anaerolineae bacterium]